MLREILQELDSNLSYDDLDQIIDEVDADGSGTVDFDGNKILKPNSTTSKNYLITFLLFFQNSWK